MPAFNPHPVVIDLADDDPPPSLSLYLRWCLFHLSSAFPRLRLTALRSALKLHNDQLLPAYDDIASSYHDAILKEQNKQNKKMQIPSNPDSEEPEEGKPFTRLKLMKCPRSIFPKKPRSRCPLFDREWPLLQVKLMRDAAEVATSSAVENVLSDKIECGCCCSEVSFDELVQCADGHLFCSSCLRRRVEELTYGGIPACGPLLCIDMSGCQQSIPLSEIKRTIKAELLLKFEERQISDSVARAKIQGLVYCPFCNFACEMDQRMSILRCPEASCRKESCVKCKEPSHIPLRCEEVEKPSDTRCRNQIEEIMSESVVRKCVSCNAELIKDGGCNKITCRCGQSMCYICRKAITDYKHFCPHVRSPGKKCTKCRNCSLWEQEDESAVVSKAKRKALESKATENSSIVGREIGPADILFKKKKRN